MGTTDNSRAFRRTPWFPPTVVTSNISLERSMTGFLYSIYNIYCIQLYEVYKGEPRTNHHTRETIQRAQTMKHLSRASNRQLSDSVILTVVKIRLDGELLGKKKIRICF